MRLANKIAMITGAGSGMGRTTAILFASEGAKVAVADISQEGVDETVKEITAKGGQAIALRCRRFQNRRRGADGSGNGRALGPPTVLYNNAGIEGEAPTSAR